MQDGAVIGADDPEFDLLLAVIKVALRDLRSGADSPHYPSAVAFLRALGVLNERDELDQAQLVRGGDRVALCAGSGGNGRLVIIERTACTTHACTSRSVLTGDATVGSPPTWCAFWPV